MNIIILSRSGRKSRRIHLNSAGLVASAGLAILVSCGLFYSGVEYATAHTSELAAQITAQTNAVWKQEVAAERSILQRVKQNAEKSLDAMASRLSLLQGHMLRLDALGSRLASMAKIQDMNFDADNPPGMGGPSPPRSMDQASIDVPDFMRTLDELEVQLQDKAEKLSAMESMLIDRSLQEQTLPTGLPAPGSWISSPFGWRTDPITGKREFHEGIDLAGQVGTPITSVAAGIVTWAGPRFGYGRMVEISHGNGYVTRYAHNRKLLVSVGEKVDKGEVIALMGSSGRSTGPHVHFEVLRYGTQIDPRQHMSLR